MLQDILTKNLVYWQKHANIHEWLHNLGDPTLELMSDRLKITEFYSYWEQQIQKAQSTEELKDIPAFTEIAAMYRDYITLFSTLSHRIQYIFYLLGLPTMVDLMNHLLWDLNRQLADLFRNRNIINAHPNISQEFDSLLKKNLQQMEHYTRLIFGDPEKLLLLSVRSGAPMSLPGAMDTFLNIGLNGEITQQLSLKENYGWTAFHRKCYETHN
nr:pyruvate, orthophosphate dikinase [Candidatus Cloacimonadota bacterium]